MSGPPEIAREEIAVSVIVPAHDAAATIGRALDSLLAQTFARWEAVVVDDGSADDTARIVEAYAARDARISLVRQANAGPGAARNAGIARARHAWLAFLDADDHVRSEWLARLTAPLADDARLDAVHCGWAFVGPDGRIIDESRCPLVGDLFDGFARYCLFAIHACVVRRACVEAVGGFDDRAWVGEDWTMWQRVARRGARFGAVRETLACYDVREGSLSRDLEALFEASLAVTRLGHGPDPRVPDGPHAAGRAPGELASAQAAIALWIGGMMLARGGDPLPLIARVASGHLALDPRRAADSIAHALPLALGDALGVPADRWPALEPRLAAFLGALETRAGAPALARAIRIALARRILERDPDRGTARTCGPLHRERVELSRPIGDLRLPDGAERALIVVELSGESLGAIELPAADGVVLAPVIRDAIADRFAWIVLGRFFARTRYRGVEYRREPDGWSAWEHGTVLARALPDDESARAEALHDAVGWHIFLDALWGEPRAAIDVPAARPSRWSGALHHLVRRAAPTGGDWLAIETSDGVPAVRTELGHITVALTAGGAPVGAFELGAEGGVLDAAALRQRLEDAAGYELCRVVVREALVGVPWSDKGTLRERLAASAASRVDAPHSRIIRGDATAVAPAWRRAIDRLVADDARATLIARRIHLPLGGAGSRVAALPGELRDVAVAAEEREGTPIARAGSGRRESLLYAPALLWRRAHGDPAPRRTIDDAPHAPSSRHQFEALFAKGADPWRYTSDYERAKYDDTFALIPEGRIARALELACAEGHFTARLASRVGSLIAADISEIALERAAERCAAHPNIEYRRVDLVADPIPGPVDLLVCSEVLYYVGDRDALRAVAAKLAGALAPGGHLVTAHAHVLADDPDRTGYDWDVPFGGRTVVETFAATPGLALVRELRTPLYRVALFRGDDASAAAPVIVETDRIVLPLPDVAARIRWNGGPPARPAADARAVQPLPILMYHRVAPEGVPERDRWRVSPDVFERQLRYLRDCGFRSVTLEAWRAAAARREPLPGQPLVLTFDDGFADFAEHAWPRLQRYGFGALVLLVSGSVGRWNGWDPDGEREPLLDWDTIARLRDEGVQFGAHTVTHPRLTGLAPVDVARELLASRLEIERRLGQRVTTFAYPHGDEDEVVRHLVGAAGFAFGLSCRSGSAHAPDPLLALPRIEVRGDAGHHEFIASLAT